MNNVCFNVLSLNVRGIRDLNNRKSIFTWVRNQKADIIFLQETFSTSVRQYVSTSVRQYVSTSVRQYVSTSVRQYVSTSVRQYVSTSVRQYVSTSVRQYVSTSVRQYVSTSVRQIFLIVENFSGGEICIIRTDQIIAKVFWC